MKHELDVSLTGSYLITKYFGEKMKKQKKKKLFSWVQIYLLFLQIKKFKSFGNFLNHYLNMVC